MGFVPIKIGERVRKFLNINKGQKSSEVRARVERALRDYKAGIRCSCGEPIWVIGSAEVGNACFTCITGDVDPSEDYEIAEACEKWAAPGVDRHLRRGYGEAQRHSWPDAKKLCRLNENDIAMAKALGFYPDALVRARPDPKQKWKLPVKEWIHELHFSGARHSSPATGTTRLSE